MSADLTLCIIDTQTHALAARAMRLSLAERDFAEALFLSDRDGDTGGGRFIPIPTLMGREAYSRFVIQRLHEFVETPHVLLIQWDGYVVDGAAWSDDFLGYDYIGARWGFHQDGHNVGNGGFSLRSRRLLAALRDPEITRFEPEDEVICRHYRPMLETRHGVRFAPGEVADRFAYETTYPKGPTLGFHGLFNLWRFVRDDEVPDLIAAMPRSVVGSIQYLTLAKNFMDLKRVDPARAMLAYRQQLFPADSQTAGMLAALTPPARRVTAPESRNAPCPCGSGKRFKHCCGAESEVPQGGGRATAESADGQLSAAMAHHAAGRLALARAGYEAVLGLRDDALAEHYLGVIEMQEGRPEAGEARIRAALAKRADLPDMHNNLGLCLRAQGRLAEATAAYRQALDLHPGYAPAWSNLGLDSHKLGQLEVAHEALNRALALDPSLVQARFTRSLLLLARGDYSQGWTEYQARMQCPEYAGHYRLPAIEGRPAPWRGEPLAGKSLLLIGEQGIGDTLQFIRYARGLSAQGARVSLYLRQAHVAGWLRHAAGVAAVYAAEDPVPAHDHACHLLSLPVLCGTRSLADIPAQVPYLSVPEPRRQAWRQRLEALPAGLRIGLAWAGSPSHQDDRYRSLTLAQLAPLLALPGVHWINLQLGAARAQLAAQPGRVIDWGDDQTDYAETAALVAELDLVLSVDTSIAHASGALGVPVWVMLQHQPDFRWLLDRDDSPWYPSARLFRQPSPGDWPGVVEAVRAALLARMEGEGVA
mgnify:CR=1 FL=1